MQSETIPQPVVTARARGGWLAVSDESQPIRIGVVGDDEQSTRQAFERSIKRWMELHVAAVTRDDA